MRLKPILFFLLVGSLATYVVVQQTQRGDGGVIKIGQIAPDFTARDISGKQVHLSDYRGKLVFLNFWWRWCDPCIAEMPDIDTFYKTFKERKFEMITVNIDPVTNDPKQYMAEQHLTFPWYSDP